MSLEQTLTKDFINSKSGFVRKEYASYLHSQSFLLKNKEPDLAHNYSVSFISSYLASKEIIDKKFKFNDSITRLSAVYIASEIFSGMNNNSINIFDFKFLDTTNGDYDLNLKILKSYTTLLNSTPITIDLSTQEFFGALKNRVQNNLIKAINQNDLDTITKIAISGKSNMNLFKYAVKVANSNETTELKKIDFVNTKYEDIIGNKEVKNSLTMSLKKLFLYNKEIKQNPALLKRQFNQNFLLVGEPGTGKGMVSSYAATLGFELAKKTNKEFSVIAVDCNSVYQDGPVIELIKYFNEINKGEQLYLILMDEIDSAFTSRNDTKTQNYQKKVVTELLKFSGSTTNYINKGNYIFLGITNNPSELDRAFLDRMRKGYFVCEGAKTREEKALLIRNLLKKHVPENKIHIKNWELIGDTAYNLNLSGRSIAGCVENLLENHGNKDIPDNLYTLNFDEQLNFFNNFKIFEDKHIFDELLKLSEKNMEHNFLVKGKSYVKT